MIIYASLFTFVCGYNFINLIISIIVVCIGIIFFVYRFCVYLISFNKAKKEESKIVDFCEIYEYKDNKKYDLPILLDEKDVEYDLLGREFIIKQLVSSVKNYNTEGSYVIGLAGPWGSGKTTIVNNAMLILKKENDDIIAINFNPWIYETQDSMLKAMLNAILKSTDVSYDSSFLNKIYKAAKQVMGLNEYSKTIANVLTGLENKEKYDLKIITEQISNFLAINNKYVVFIIDNIERATSDNVIFLFKLLGTLFDLKRVTYVLVYDKERLEEIFNDVKNIDSHYIEKIIQQELTVPAIDDNKLCDIYKSSFRNLLKIYNQSDEIDDSEYQPIYDFICNKRMSLRDFKRLVNSTFPIVFPSESGLYKPDLLALQIVQFFNVKLYNAIKNNEYFFVSCDRNISNSLTISMLSELESRKSCNSFFDELKLNEDKAILDLLSEVFPIVYKYSHGEDILLLNYNIDIFTYQNIEKQCRACSAKYFNLYFTFSNNNYLIINNNLSHFISFINTNNEATDEELSKWIITNNEIWQEEIFFKLNNRLKEIVPDAQFLIAKFLTVSFSTFYSSSIQIHIRNMAKSVIYNIIKTTNIENFQEYVNNISGDYSKLTLIEYLFDEMQQDQEKSNLSDKITLIEIICNQMCSKIISESINIYIETNYDFENIWVLYRYLEKHKEQGTISEYILKVINEDTVFKILWDITDHSTDGNSHSYAIIDKYYKILFENINVSYIINRKKDLTDSQIIVKEIYNEYLTGKGDHFGRKPVKYDKPLNIKF